MWTTNLALPLCAFCHCRRCRCRLCCCIFSSHAKKCIWISYENDDGDDGNGWAIAARLFSQVQSLRVHTLLISQHCSPFAVQHSHTARHSQTYTRTRSVHIKSSTRAKMRKVRMEQLTVGGWQIRRVQHVKCLLIYMRFISLKWDKWLEEQWVFWMNVPVQRGRHRGM